MRPNTRLFWFDIYFTSFPEKFRNLSTSHDQPHSPRSPSPWGNLGLGALQTVRVMRDTPPTTTASSSGVKMRAPTRPKTRLFGFDIYFLLSFHSIVKVVWKQLLALARISIRMGIDCARRRAYRCSSPRHSAHDNGFFLRSQDASADTVQRSVVLI
jgi:hypothetical protein